MSKKGSMELSVNSIVILVIAIVMLGLILGFVRSKFAEVSIGLDSKEPDPAVATASDPVTLSRNEISVNAGKEAVLKISVYNSDVTDSTATTPFIDCSVGGGSPLAAVPSTNPKAIASTKSAQFSLILKIKPDATAGTYLCSLDSDVLTNQVQDFTIKVVR